MCLKENIPGKRYVMTLFSEEDSEYKKLYSNLNPQKRKDMMK